MRQDTELAAAAQTAAASDGDHDGLAKRPDETMAAHKARWEAEHAEHQKVALSTDLEACLAQGRDEVAALRGLREQQLATTRFPSPAELSGCSRLDTAALGRIAPELLCSVKDIENVVPLGDSGPPLKIDTALGSRFPDSAEELKAALGLLGVLPERPVFTEALVYFQVIQNRL